MLHDGRPAPFPMAEALIHTAGSLGISATEEAFGLVEDQDGLHGTRLWRKPRETPGKSVGNPTRNGGFNR